MNKYQELGFKSRKAYLEDLALEHDVDEELVLALAEVRGPTEDFDGLVSSLQDLESW